MPSAPTGLKYISVPNGIKLSWFPVVGAVSYNIFRSSDALSLFSTQLNTSPITGTTYTDTTLSSATNNFYSVVSVDGGSAISTPSLIISVAAIGLDIVPRVDLHESKFSQAIEEKGYKVVWEKAISCPCNKASQKVTDATDLDCPLCKNKHYIYFNPIEIKCLMTSLTRRGELSQDGQWLLGTYMVTTKPENKFGVYDRLRFVDTTASYTEALVKGTANGSDQLRFPAVSVELPIEDIDGNTYVYGTDFGVNASGNIIWGGFSGSQPSTGKTYGVRYITHWQMLIVDFPHDQRATYVQQQSSVPVYSPLALQAVGKLEFFINT